jgi:MerR family mercuric resistance operon transcriptional regulator
LASLAAAAGVNVETIRYYQRRGLLEEPKKPLGEYRNYPTETVNRIRFIKRAQALGFTLEELAGLLRLNNTDACAKTRDLAAQKVASIEQKLSQLQTMRDALVKLVHQCDKKLKSSPYPIIQILELAPITSKANEKPCERPPCRFFDYGAVANDDLIEVPIKYPLHRREHASAICNRRPIKTRKSATGKVADNQRTHRPSDPRILLAQIE